MNKLLLENDHLRMEYDGITKAFIMKLIEIPKGYYVCMTVGTQARYNGNFALTQTINNKSSNMLTGAKTDSNVEFQNIPLDQNPAAAYYKGEDLTLKLYVDVEQPDEHIKLSGGDNFLVIEDSKKNQVGVVYVLCFEDWNDNDFNDFVFTISAWKEKG